MEICRGDSLPERCLAGRMSRVPIYRVGMWEHSIYLYVTDALIDVPTAFPLFPPEAGGLGEQLGLVRR